MSKNNNTKDIRVAVSSQRVFDQWDSLLFILLTCMSGFAIVYFLSCWFSSQDWLEYPKTFSIMTLILVPVIVSNQLRWFLLPFMRRPKPMAIHSEWKVGVVTTFVPDAEPLGMLEETLKALVALDYPHDTWVLDEADDVRVKALCVRVGAQHFSRRKYQCYQSENGT